MEAQAELGRDPEVASALAGEAANDLSEKIFQPEDPRTSSLGQLATNPLMLQILCLVHRDRKQLPERRVELYRECVQVLLELWRRAKGMPVDLDAPQALRLLRPLAYRLHAAEKREAPLAELLPGQARYGFLHLSFQEYRLGDGASVRGRGRPGAGRETECRGARPSGSAPRPG